MLITRTYPPVLGGMETLSFNLIKNIQKLTETITIINPYGKKALPLFLPWAFLKAVWVISFRRVRIIHLSDGVLAPIGYILKLFFKNIKVVCNLHGLDVTYAQKSKIFSAINLPAIKKMDLLIAVSEGTSQICADFGLPADKIVIIPNGTEIDENYRREIKENFAKKSVMAKKILPANDFFANKENFLILSLGRIVKRKGLAWFVRRVMPKLPNSAKLIVAGSGPEEAKIKQLVEKYKLQKRVLMLGFISNRTKKFLLNACDILIMPNLSVAGDREGFGITAIEAGAAELLPLVSGIEGLKDAVKHKKNGLVLPSLDAEKYLKTVELLMENPALRIRLAKEARVFVRKHFDWQIIIQKYLIEFKKIDKNI